MPDEPVYFISFVGCSTYVDKATAERIVEEYERGDKTTEFTDLVGSHGWYPLKDFEGTWLVSVACREAMTALRKQVQGDEQHWRGD